MPSKTENKNKAFLLVLLAQVKSKNIYKRLKDFCEYRRIGNGERPTLRFQGNSRLAIVVVLTTAAFLVCLILAFFDIGGRGGREAV